VRLSYTAVRRPCCGGISAVVHQWPRGGDCGLRSGRYQHVREDLQLGARSDHGRLSASELRFVEWARKSAAALGTTKPCPPWDDLTPLGAMIGEASVVALSEAVHCGAEPLDFRNRVLQYLVEEHGFTAIAIESGIVESRTVYDYVRGGAGDLDTVLARGIGWTFDRLPQNEALIRWLRQYNRNPRHGRKVNFYGFDIPGSPPSSKANRGVDTALTEVLAYLHRVDVASAEVFHARLDSLLQHMRFDLQGLSGSPGYEQLSQTERDCLTAAVADLVTLLERCEARYTAASSVTDYAWAHRAAVGARHVDAWLRQVPVGWRHVGDPRKPRTEHISFFPVALDVRDRAQADNIEWIVRQEGPSGKILVFAARYHLSAAPVKSSFWRMNGTEREQEVAGSYLRRQLGSRLLTIGNVIGQARTDVSCGLHRAPRQSIDWLTGLVGMPLFLLDLRRAPVDIARWLQQEHELADESQALKLRLSSAFDVLLYIHDVSPASEGRALEATGSR